MATRKRGVLTVAKFNLTCKHLRPSGKRAFWHRERWAARRAIRTELAARRLMMSGEGSRLANGSNA